MTTQDIYSARIMTVVNELAGDIGYMSRPRKEALRRELQRMVDRREKLRKNTRRGE